MVDDKTNFELILQLRKLNLDWVVANSAREEQDILHEMLNLIETLKTKIKLYIVD